MGFSLNGFEANRPTQNPHKRNKEPIYPPLFRPPTLLFHPKNGAIPDVNMRYVRRRPTLLFGPEYSSSSNNMSNTNDASASIRAGPLSFQAGTSISSNRTAMHLLFSGFIAGTTAVTIGIILRSPLINNPVTTDRALILIILMIIFTLCVISLTKPEELGSGAPPNTTGANSL